MSGSALRAAGADSSSELTVEHKAGAYLRKDAIYVFSNSRTTIGWVIYSGLPPRRLNVSATDAEIGAAIRAAEAEYSVGVPQEPPDRDDAKMRPFLKAAGAQSWRAFVTGARFVQITFADATVRMYPTQRRGLGFAGRAPDDAIVAEHPSDERLGAMLRECFARCA